jgi:hypothetical protein
MPPTYTVDLSPAGGGSPEAPVKVPMGGGAGVVSYATGSITVLGNAADAALEILGYYYGVEQTAPLPGKTMAESYAIALAAEINASWSEGGLRPSATVTGATVHLTAGLGGLPGNLINLTSSDANVVPSGPFLTGGGGDSTITVSGALTKNGSAAVVFPALAVDQSRASSQTEFSSNGWDYDTGGPPLTGWYYTAQIQGVFTGTFPSMVLSGYRWVLKATRYAAGAYAEQASWKSALQPTSHPIDQATGWAPDSPATGTPTVTPPTGVSASPPHTIAMPGAGGGSPSAPHTLTMAGAGGGSPSAPATVPMTGTGGGSPDAPNTVPL